MDLYFANPSHQKAIVPFRLPEERSQRRLEIPAGRQLQILSGHPKETVDYVLAQFRAYGIQHVSDAVRRPAGFTNLVWSENPITIENFRVIGDDNKKALAEKGEHMRDAMAAGAASIIKNTVLDAQIPGSERIVGDLSSELETVSDDYEGEKLNDKVRVSETATQGRRSK